MAAIPTLSNDEKPAFELVHVSKRFEDHSVLDDVSLRINQGDMVALTGPSGSGKSTLLNILGLLQAPDEGQLRIMGETAPRPRSRAANEYLRHVIGYLFQNYALIDDDTVRANLAPALAYRPAQDRNRRRATELMTHALREVGLGTARINQPVFTLSGGEQQRVAVARLLLKPCSIVLADEPTGSLDAANRDGIIDLLHELNMSGKTVIVATHDPVLVAACQRPIDVRQTAGREASPN